MSKKEAQSDKSRPRNATRILPELITPRIYMRGILVGVLVFKLEIKGTQTNPEIQQKTHIAETFPITLNPEVPLPTKSELSDQHGQRNSNRTMLKPFRCLICESFAKRLFEGILDVPSTLDAFGELL